MSESFDRTDSAEDTPWPRIKVDKGAVDEKINIFTQNIEQLAGVSVNGMMIGALEGVNDFVPLKLRLLGMMHIEQAQDGKIAFLHIQKQVGLIQPLLVRGLIHIEQLKGSHLAGVIIEESAVNESQPEAGGGDEAE